MPRRATHRLAWHADARAYELSGGDDPATIAVVPGAPSWHEWLDAVPSFAFTDRSGRACTVRKEAVQRGGAYWYAYGRVDGRMVKRYLGRGADLTLERLEAVAAALASSPPAAAVGGGAREHDGRCVARPRGRRAARAAPARDVPHLLLATKLGAPRPPGRTVDRLHVLRRLERGLERPLTVVAAPAGFGKTTALGAWARHAAAPVAWVSLDPDDNDPRQFWTYALTALDRAQPGVAKTALAMLGAPQSPPVGAALRVLVNALAGAARDVALVLDDYHLITEPAIHDGLTLLLEHPPARLHIYLVTRGEPPMPLGRLRARDQLNEVRADDLRFRPDEVGAFLTEVMDVRLPVEDVLHLAERTDGWAAGVQIAGISLRDSADPTGFVAGFNGGHRHVLTYLGEEVLATQSAQAQEFLLKTSILQRMCGPLCDALTGRDDGQATLERLERSNLFVVPLDDEGRWYRYYHLLADLLRHQLRRESPSVLPDLHRRAARWLEGQGTVVEATEHLLAVPDTAEAARVIETAAEDLVRRGEISTLLRLIARLPEEAVASRPFLCISQARALFAYGRLAEIERRIDQAEQGLPAEEASRRQTLAGAIAAARAVLFAMRGDADATIAQAEIALANLPLRDDLTRGGLAVPLGHAYRFKGNLRAAGATYAEAARSSLAADNLFLASVALSQQASTLLLLGRPRQAADIYRQVIRLAEQRGGPAQALAAGAYNDLSACLYEWNDLVGAALALEKALALGDQWENAEDQVAGYTRLAPVYQAQGKTIEAVEAIERAETILRSGTHFPWLAPLASATAARLALRQGRAEAAARWARERDLRADDSPPVGWNAIWEVERLTLARLLLVQGQGQGQGQGQTALQVLRLTLTAAEAEERTGDVIEILALLALAHQSLGDSERALDALARSATLAEPEGYVRTYVDEGAPMRALLARLRERQARGSSLRRYLDVLLAAFERGAGAQTSPAQATAVLNPLSERELEVLHLLASGHSNQEIARRLVVAVSTVKTHMHHLLDKLQASDRLQAVTRARELGLLER